MDKTKGKEKESEKEAFAFLSFVKMCRTPFLIIIIVMTTVTMMAAAVAATSMHVHNAAPFRDRPLVPLHSPNHPAWKHCRGEGKVQSESQ